jgi:hypothetical protein
MESFQKIVLFAAIFILIVALIFIGMTLASAKDPSWPPIVPECPDYWVADGSGNMNKCINVKDLGICPATGDDEHLIMDFNTSAYTGSQGACAKYTWANKCGLSWDGITYGVRNPCQQSTESPTDENIS